MILPALNPKQGVRGEQGLTVGFPGPGLVQGVTTADFGGDGITVNSVTVTGPHSALVNINIDPTAPLSRHAVTLTTANNIAEAQFDVVQGGNKTLSVTDATQTVTLWAPLPLLVITRTLARVLPQWISVLISAC